MSTPTPALTLEEVRLVDDAQSLSLESPVQVGFAPQPQCTLLGRLAPELRTRIFEYAVTEDGGIRVPMRTDDDQAINKENHLRAAPSPITQVSRQARLEALPLFFQLNNFVFDTRHFASQWLNAKSHLLCFLHHITFEVAYCDYQEGPNDDKPLSITAHWNTRAKQWSIYSTDDHSTITPPFERGYYIYSSQLLHEILAAMLDQRTPEAFSAAHLLWMSYDLKKFYYRARLIEPPHDTQTIVGLQRATSNLENLDYLCGLKPDVARPAGMYARDLEAQYLQAPRGCGAWMEAMKQQLGEFGIRLVSAEGTIDGREFKKTL